MHVDLRFAALTHRGTVYVNGREIISHEGGFLPFSARIDDVVRWNEKNLVVVKGNNELSFTSLPAGFTQTLKSGKKWFVRFLTFSIMQVFSGR